MQLAIDSDLELFTSPILVDELSEVLRRRHLTKKLLEQRTSVGQLCALYRQL
jgi:predicted nucleic acid-binding protein